MREIKFRGRKSNGVWIYGDLVTVETTDGIPTKKEILPFDAVIFDATEEVEEDTIGLFTGLHDKNGKEIYEGDILLLPANTKVKAYEKGDFVEDKFVQRFAVVWAKQCQGYGLCQPYEAKFETPDVVGMAAVDRMFVIGNIHDNPELLNEKK